MTARVRVMGTPEHTEDVAGDTGNSLPVFAEQELCHRGCPETKPNNFKKMPFWILGGAQKLHFSSFNLGSVEVSFLILSFFHILADIFHIINEVIHDPGILDAAGRTIEEDLFYA